MQKVYHLRRDLQVFFEKKREPPNFLRFRKDIFSLALWVYHEPGGFLRFLPVFVKECSEI